MINAVLAIVVLIGDGKRASFDLVTLLLDLFVLSVLEGDGNPAWSGFFFVLGDIVGAVVGCYRR